MAQNCCKIVILTFLLGTHCVQSWNLRNNNDEQQKDWNLVMPGKQQFDIFAFPGFGI